jgi:membrane protein
VLLDFLFDNLPVMRGDPDLTATLEAQIQRIVGGRRRLTLVGGLLLVWLSTRLVGTLRTVLREVFEVARDRSALGGKIFDMEVVAVGGVLFLTNFAITTVLTAARDRGVDVLGLQGYALTLVQHTFARTLAFVSIWVLFLGIYRYLPVRRTPWRTSLLAATCAAVVHEALKLGFGWYVTELANYRSTYGNLITLAVLFFWIYYEALVFILAAEFAQVWTMRRASK